jgi:aspartate kinase
MSSHGGSSLLVVKFGGTSLATPQRVRRAAERLGALRARGHAVVAVVSAAAGTTDRILDWLTDLSGGGGADREADRALATGEVLSAAFLATALKACGVPARSLSGATRLDRTPIHSVLEAGFLPVVAGFQASLEDSGETVTLGRGASDLSAVFLALHLSASECHIVTDVDGVYAHDPRVRRKSTRFASLSHGHLCELARGGARVVQAAAAELARDHGLPLRIYHYRAPLNQPAGTVVGPGESGLDLPVSA